MKEPIAIAVLTFGLGMVVLMVFLAIRFMRKPKAAQATEPTSKKEGWLKKLVQRIRKSISEKRAAKGSRPDKTTDEKVSLFQRLLRSVRKAWPWKKKEDAVSTVTETLSEEEERKQKEEELKQEAKRKRTKRGVRIMLFIAACVYTIILILWMYCRIQLGEKDVRDIGDTTVTLSGVFLALALFIATVDGLLIPKRDEFVAFYFLEKYLFTKGPGGLVWRFRLFNILTAYRIKIILHSVEVEFTARTGGPGSIIYRDGENAEMYEGNHLHEQLPVRVKVVVEFDIDDAEQFGMKVRTVENAIDLFRENIIEAGRQEIGKNTLATMDGKLEEAAQPMKLKLEQYVEQGAKGERAGRLGVNIRTYKIIELEPDQAVLNGLNTIATSHMGVKTAANQAEAAKRTAEGEKYRLTAEGLGNANAKRSVGMAEAAVEKAKQEAIYGPQLDYQKEMAAIAGTEGGLNSLKLFTLEKAYANNTKIVTTQEQAGFANLLTLATTVTKP